MSEINTEQPRRFATRVLPWLIAAAFFVIYLATLNRWVSASSLGLMAQISGWDGQVPIQSPLMWLITRPLRLFGEQNLPVAANALTALLAAGSMGLLARCVAIFPADRTHSQRIRGQLEGLPLDAPFNWVPPLMAAGLLGFQLTVWEHATVVTGEMLNLFIFAFAARCLAQYRLDERDWRLQEYMFVLGLGCANDWSMVAYFPLFMLALVWVVGWELLNARRLVTLVVSLAFGLLLYLLMPIVASGAPGMSGSFGGRFLELLRFQKTLILTQQRSRPLLMALVVLLPIAFVSVRWASGGSSSTDQKIKNFFLILLRLLWFAAGIYVAYDAGISIRTMVTTHPQGGGLTLLTFSWIGALTVGVSAGWLVLLGTASPDKKWQRSASGVSILTKLGAAICIVGTVVIPATLAWRNLPKLRLQNGPILAQMADDLRHSLPDKPAIVLTEDSFLSAVLQAALHRDATSPRHLLLQTRQAVLSEYRQKVYADHKDDFPELAGFARAETNVAGVFLELLYTTAHAGRAFYLNPVVFDPRNTFLLESLHTRPQGMVYAIEPYAPGEISPPPLTSAQADRVVSDWTGRTEYLATVTNAAAARILTAEIAARIYSRAANATGVELQRSGRLVEARRLFDLAQALLPENVAAAVNANVNAALQARQPITAEARKPLIGLPPLAVVESLGPVDDPEFLGTLAMALSQAQVPLPRAAAVAASRALELAPENVGASEAFARAALAAGEPKLAADAVARARRLATAAGVQPRVLAGIELLQARLLIGSNDIQGAEKTLVEAWKKYPEDAPLIEGISDFYSSLGMATNALLYTDHYLRLHKDDDVILARRGGLLVEAGRPAEAVDVLDGVLGRRPDNYEARLSRGAAQLLLNKPAAARSDFEFLLKDNPIYARALLGLGRACLAEKNEGDAQRHFQKVVELTPTNNVFHLAAKAQLESMQRRR